MGHLFQRWPRTRLCGARFLCSFRVSVASPWSPPSSSATKTTRKVNTRVLVLQSQPEVYTHFRKIQDFFIIILISEVEETFSVLRQSGSELLKWIKTKANFLRVISWKKGGGCCLVFWSLMTSTVSALHPGCQRLLALQFSNYSKGRIKDFRTVESYWIAFFHPRLFLSTSVSRHLKN